MRDIVVVAAIYIGATVALVALLRCKALADKVTGQMLNERARQQSYAMWDELDRTDHR